MIYEFFVITGLLQSATSWVHLLFWFFLRKNTTKCDEQRKFHEFLNDYYNKWQKVVTKCDRYYKVRQSLLQSVTGIKKCDNYYKERS